MKNKAVVGLIGAVALVLHSGCAQPAPAPSAVQITPASGPAADPPQEVSAPPDALQPPVPAESVQAQGTVAVPSGISPGAAEVVRLASSGVTEDVILAYVNNSQASFDLAADQVVYLKDLGLSSQVVTAMINRDTALRTQAAQNTPPPPIAIPAPQPAPPSPPVVEAPMTPTVETTPPEDVSYFYNDLSPYGSWVTLDDVGWCWQPRTVVVSHGWRPYCDGGHWVYADCGWYWQSDYSWGWAPFHYGRWYLHPRCGWVWTPDRTWGPAWVSWRVAGDNCGWAPLPPHAVFDVHGGWRYNGVRVGINFDFGLRPDHFTFVAVHDFTHHDLGHRALPIREVRNVYRQTTIVNNTTVINNNVIVNRGIPVDRVSVATHTQIRPATLRDGGPGRDRNVASGGSGGRTENVVYRHELTAKPKPTRVVAQKVDANHPIVQHNELPPVRTDRYGTGSRSGSPQNVRTRTTSPETARQPGQPVSPTREARPATRESTVRDNQPSSVTTRPVSRPTAPTVADAPRNPGEQPRPTVNPSRPTTRESTTRDNRPSPVISRPANTPSTAPVVEGPRTPGERPPTSPYGRYSETPRSAAPLQSPKQYQYTPPQPSRNAERYSSDSSRGNAHDYNPKGYQQPAERYSPPARSERSPAPSSGGAVNRDNSGSRERSAPRDNPAPRDDSRGGRKDR